MLVRVLVRLPFAFAFVLFRCVWNGREDTGSGCLVVWGQKKRNSHGHHVVWVLLFVFRLLLLFFPQSILNPSHIRVHSHACLWLTSERQNIPPPLSTLPVIYRLNLTASNLQSCPRCCAVLKRQHALTMSLAKAHTESV